LVGSAVVRVCGRIVDAASEAAATKAFVGAVATRVCGAYSRVAASGEAVTKAIAGAMAA
jgi:hypothetical protein